MSGFVFAISSFVCTVLVAVVILFWSRRDYGSIKIAFALLIPTCVVFGIVVLSAYWYYVVKPTQATKDTVASRPELHVGFQSISLVLDKPPVITTIIRNTGSADAHHARLCSSAHIWPKSFEGPLKWDNNYVKESGGMPEVIPSQGFHVEYVSTGHGMPMTQKRLDAIADGSYVLYWATRGTYEDASGNRFILKPICFFYDPDQKVMYVCRKQYVPTEDDPNNECPGAN